MCFYYYFYLYYYLWTFVWNKLDGLISDVDDKYRLTLTDSVSCTSSTWRALSIKSINSTSSSDDSGVLEARSKIIWNSLQILSKNHYRHCVLFQLVLINCRLTLHWLRVRKGSCRYQCLSYSCRTVLYFKGQFFHVRYLACKNQH